MRAVLRAGAALLAAFVATGARVPASTVGIVPTRLAIARAGSSADLTLENGGAGTTAYSVRAFRWHQQPGGEIALDPTDDVIVYPQRLMLGPFERRTIRVGYEGALLASEQDFRIVVTEGASSDADVPSGVLLRVRSKLSVPLFVAPVASKIGAEVRDASFGPNRFRFALAASGSVHVFSTGVNVRGLDASGAEVFAAALPSWYVLPGQPRTYDVPFDAKTCARVRRIAIDATFDAAPPLHANVEPPHSC